MSVLNVKSSILSHDDQIKFKKEEDHLVAQIVSNSLVSNSYPVDPSYATIPLIPQELQTSPKKMVKWLIEQHYRPILKDGQIVFEADSEFEEIKKCYANLKSQADPSIYALLDLQDRISNIRVTSDYDELIEGIEKLALSACETECVEESEILPPSTHTFVHEGQRYEIKLTRGKSSCSLHALLGEEIQGIYRFPGNDCDVAAKQLFLNALKEALATGNERIIVDFISIVMDHLFDLDRDNLYEARCLFSRTSTGCELGKQLRVIRMSPQTEMTQMEQRTLILSEAMVTLYVDAVKMPGFYLNTQEIKLAATLFRKNVLIFGSKPITLAEEIHEGEDEEPIVIHHNQLHFSRCVKAKKVAALSEKEVSQQPIWHEDTLPSGFFHLKKGTVVAVHGDSIEIAIKRKDAEQINLKICEYLADDPASLYHFAKTASLPKAQAVHFQSQALAQIIESAEEESKKALGERDNQKYSQILDKIELLRQTKTDLQKDLNEIKKPINRTVQEYFKKSFFLSYLGGSQEEIDEFFALLDTLKEVNHDSLIPYYPVLTMLAHRIEKATLKRLLQEARQRDCYLTYAVVLGYARAALTFKDKLLWQDYQPHTVIEVLREVYPEDLTLPVYLEILKSQSEGAFSDFSTVAPYLQRALEALALGNISCAIEQIVKGTPLLCGFSNLHRYLAIAWSCHGEFDKAKQIVKRASQLPNVHVQNVTQSVTEIICMISNAAMTKKLAKPEKSSDPAHDLLTDFVEMCQSQPLSLDLATQFVERAASLLHSDLEQLPLVYFGIQNLTARISVGARDKFEEVYRPLFIALGECISILLYICYDLGNLDPWIAEISEKKEKGDQVSFLIKAPSIQFGLLSAHKKEIPFFEFLDSLHLTRKSARALATCITKEVYGLWLGLMTSHLMPSIGSEDVPLPDDPLIFTGILQSGLINGVKGMEASFLKSAAHLNKYLAIQPDARPYLIDPQSLEWAKFCVFTINQTVNLVENSFYPENFALPKTQELFKAYKTLIASASSGSLMVQNAVRDAYLADHVLKNRSSLQTLVLSETHNLYSLHKIAQTLFGWHHQETFKEWGIRLKNAELFGPGASDLNLMESMTPNDSLSSEPDTLTLEGNLPAKEREALRALLQFWIRFYKKTEEHNDFIRQGFDEDTGDAVKDWSKDILLEKWLSIVAHNEPKEYPGFLKLPKKEQTALIEMVKNKHSHHQEVQKLKKLCQRSGHLSSDDFVVSMAIVMLINAEFERNTTHHSVFMENEAQARQLYQLLLEISIERTVRNALIPAGMQGWVNFSKIQDTLLTPLNTLLGAFHGPETHISGNGPIQIHYNAGIVTSKLKPQNIHIYYNEQLTNKEPKT